MKLVGWTLIAVARALGAIAEGLEFAAETCSDASELATGTGLFLHRQGCVLLDEQVAAGGRLA